MQKHGNWIKRNWKAMAGIGLAGLAIGSFAIHSYNEYNRPGGVGEFDKVLGKACEDGTMTWGEGLGIAERYEKLNAREQGDATSWFYSKTSKCRHDDEVTYALSRGLKMFGGYPRNDSNLFRFTYEIKKAYDDGKLSTNEFSHLKDSYMKLDSSQKEDLSYINNVSENFKDFWKRLPDEVKANDPNMWMFSSHAKSSTSSGGRDDDDDYPNNAGMYIPMM